jgi:acyl carrier protein
MEQSITERFEQIVGRYPEQLAVKTRDHSLSYRELNEASNRVANALLTQRGPGNDSVALLFEHEVDVIAGMLGALKGGKLFLYAGCSFTCRGRMLPDGFLIYLERKDLQVRIRGYRVEFGEIERALLTHPQLKDAGVVAWYQESGEKYLTAYVVPCESVGPAINALYKFLRDKLPDYLKPSAFMFLQSLPLTNGKLDRTALPRPDYRRRNLEQPYAQPHGDVEIRLVQIWEDILNIRPIGIHDNFFDLGGHSLAAMRAVSQVIKQFQLELPLQSLFQSPTIAQMAAVIMEHQGKQLGQEDLKRILDELESLSDEEAQRLLAEETTSRSNGERHE